MSLSDRYLKKYEYSGSKRYELSQKNIWTYDSGCSKRYDVFNEVYWEEMSYWQDDMTFQQDISERYEPCSVISKPYSNFSL